MDNRQAAIIVHGGAGQCPEEQIAERLDGCRAAALAGWRVMAKGGTALDGAQAGVVALEDNPLFNAGTGSTLNTLGEVEMDASLMDGSNLSAGAVAAVKGVQNPIKLARAILDDGRHVLLAGEGAREFARQSGVALCSTEALITPRQHERWAARYGTVGCVARDADGGIAAATSTGGIFGKLPGRVGDSALIGCGTYADGSGGVSCTGIGEAIIRVVLGKTALDLITKDDLPPDQAVHKALALLEAKTGSEAGLVMIDSSGRIGYARNTSHMPVCVVTGSGAPVVAI